MSEVNSDYDYNYKTELQIWKGKKEIERYNISMSETPLYFTAVGINMSNAKILLLDLTPVGAKMPDPKALPLPT